MATGSCHGHIVQGYSTGEHGWRTVGKITGMHAPQFMR